VCLAFPLLASPCAGTKEHEIMDAHKKKKRMDAFQSAEQMLSRTDWYSPETKIK